MRREVEKKLNDKQAAFNFLNKLFLRWLNVSLLYKRTKCFKKSHQHTHMNGTCGLLDIKMYGKCNTFCVNSNLIHAFLIVSHTFEM